MQSHDPEPAAHELRNYVTNVFAAPCVVQCMMAPSLSVESLQFRVIDSPRSSIEEGACENAGDRSAAASRDRLLRLAALMREVGEAPPRSGSQQHESAQLQWQLLEAALKDGSKVALLHPAALRRALPHKVSIRCEDSTTCEALACDTGKGV